MRTYTELVSYETFEERFNYLRMNGKIGDETFGFERYLNQVFYRSSRWKRIRDFVIIRDNACDLGVTERPIFKNVIIHHMNPITIKDIETESDFLLDPEYLICVSINTHNAIHYGNLAPELPKIIARFPNDTSPWHRKVE